MVALRRTEQYKTIRHHLRDTRLYDMTRTAPALIHMFHTSGRDLWLRAPTPDSILKNTTGPGPLTPPTDCDTALVPVGTTRHGYVSNKQAENRIGAYDLWIEDFTDATRNYGRAFPWDMALVLMDSENRDSDAPRRSWKLLEKIWANGAYQEKTYQKLGEDDQRLVTHAANIFHHFHRWVAALMLHEAYRNVLPPIEWFTTLWDTQFPQVKKKATEDFTEKHPEHQVGPKTFERGLLVPTILYQTIRVTDDGHVRFDEETYVRILGFLLDTMNTLELPIVDVFTNEAGEERALAAPLDELRECVLRGVLDTHGGPVSDAPFGSAAMLAPVYGVNDAIQEIVARDSMKIDGVWWERPQTKQGQKVKVERSGPFMMDITST